MATAVADTNRKREATATANDNTTPTTNANTNTTTKTCWLRIGATADSLSAQRSATINIGDVVARPLPPTHPSSIESQSGSNQSGSQGWSSDLVIIASFRAKQSLQNSAEHRPIRHQHRKRTSCLLQQKANLLQQRSLGSPNHPLI